MTKKERISLLREIYQGIPTPEEKAAFERMLTSPKEQKKAWITVATSAALKLTLEQQAAIYESVALTREDRIAIASQVSRNFIFKFFSWITGGGWK